MTSDTLPQPQSTSWGQVSLSAVTQNVATGFSFGSFGTLVMAIETEFHTGRGASSLAISFLIVSLTLTATLIGRLIERVRIQHVMLAGAVLGAAGYGLLSIVHGMAALLAIYALLLGPATAMLGVITSTTHASRWSSAKQRGRAIGIVNMPIMVMIAPLVLAWVLNHHGLRTCFALLALGQILTVPLVLLIRDRTPGDAPKTTAAEVAKGPSLLRQGIFWLLAISIGLMTGAGIMKVAHLVPLLAEQGRTFDEANLLLALSGGAGLIGSLAFGALADRWGAARALILNALLQAASWTIFLTHAGMGLLIVDAIIVGACGGGVMAALGTYIATTFGTASFSRTFGLLGLFTLPFLFGMPPLTSYLYTMSGSYWLPVSVVVASFLASAAMIAAISPAERRAQYRMAAE